MGESAGGNLASLIATSAGDASLSDSSDPKVSDSVQAAIDLCGPSDFTQVPDTGPKDTAPYYVAKLLGKPPSQTPDTAREGSPVFHISPQTPPIMILHAQGDPVCPVAQSQEFYAALQKAGIPSSLTIVPVNQHVGPFFWTDDMHQQMIAFLDKSLGITQQTVAAAH
jgi:acetyl esterase/lipase